MTRTGRVTTASRGIKMASDDNVCHFVFKEGNKVHSVAVFYWPVWMLDGIFWMFGCSPLLLCFSYTPGPNFQGVSQVGL